MPLLKIIPITTPQDGERAYAKWIESNPGIKITSQHVASHNDEALIFDRIYIFYEVI
jgi:hypothetical protein